MEIKVSKESVSFGSLVKMITIGYALGFGIFYLLSFVVMIIMALFSDEAANSLSQTLVFFSVVPFVLVLQGLLLGVVVNFGLWMYRLKKPIKVEFET